MLKLILVKISFLYLFCQVGEGLSYDIQSRFNLLDDKLETHKSLGDLNSQNYYVDFNLRNSSSFKSFLESAATEIKDDTSAQKFLVNNDKTEKNLGLGFSFNLPFPFFSLFETNIKMGAFGGAKVNYFQAIMSTDLDCGVIELLIPSGLPSEIKNLFTCSYYKSLSPGDDLIFNMVGLSGLIKNAYSGKYYKPMVEGSPYFHVYSEAKGKLGLYLFLPFRERYFFDFKAYASAEGMTKGVFSYSSLKGGISETSSFSPSIETFIKSDISLFYKNKKWKFGGEFKDFIMKSVLTETDTKKPKMKRSPLVHLYGQKSFWIRDIKTKTFFGAHWRSVYKIYEGVYLGSQFLIPLKINNFNLILKGILDLENYSTSILFVSPFINLGVKARYPLRVESEGIKLSPLYNFNLNIHF